MNLLGCKICHRNVQYFICSRCKIERYCSVICQTKDWGTHILTCGRKQITINFHNNIDGMVIVGDNTKFSTITLNMYPCSGLHKLNPTAKACWEIAHDIILPTLEDLPFTISFIINNKLQNATFLNDYSNLEKDHSSTCKLGAISGLIVFDIYRNMNDEYKIFHVRFLEYYCDNIHI